LGCEADRRRAFDTVSFFQQYRKGDFPVVLQGKRCAKPTSLDIQAAYLIEGISIY